MKIFWNFTTFYTAQRIDPKVHILIADKKTATSVHIVITVKPDHTYKHQRNSTELTRQWCDGWSENKGQISSVLEWNEIMRGCQVEMRWGKISSVCGHVDPHFRVMCSHRFRLAGQFRCGYFVKLKIQKQTLSDLAVSAKHVEIYDSQVEISPAKSSYLKDSHPRIRLNGGDTRSYVAIFKAK